LCRTGVAVPSEVEQELENTDVAGVTSSIRGEDDDVIMVMSVGSEPVASMALRGARMPESVLQGIANLVAIGLERARAQELAQQIEAARQSEQLRTALIDAMAHEFKTPLTLIRATTTSLLANPDQTRETRMEQLTTANEEAEHLRELIDDAVEMARLDTTHIEVHPEISTLQATLAEVIAAMQSEVEDHAVAINSDQKLPPLAFDKRLMRLAIKQLLDNALKYSPSEKQVEVEMRAKNGFVMLEITDFGQGIPQDEQTRIFERFYRSPSVKDQIPGSGLGLSIAYRIVQAHNGELTVASQPGRTTFRMSLPILHEETV
jgi:two-component system, OmpR family, sensor histidine kinase KdpD